MLDSALPFPAPAVQPGLWAAVLVVLGGATLAWCRSSGSGSSAAEAQGGQQPSPLGLLKNSRRVRSTNRLGRAAGWVAELEQDSEMVINADMLIEGSHELLEDDHMFSALLQQGLLEDLEGFYNDKTQTFNAVLTLGRNICGHPKVVHGGLTAATMDETLGMLMFSLKRSQHITLPGPMFTVQLDISYKAKIDAGAVVLCTAEVESLEGRKLWMKATVSDGPGGTVYATARSLFVAPKPRD